MPAQDVYDLVIRPMLERFREPSYLRGNLPGQKAMLEQYVRALIDFPPAALRQGWELASGRHKYWSWPASGEIVACCEEAARQQARKQPSDHDAKIQQAEDAAWACTKRFMQTSALAARAREGGYERELRAYVRAAATVQAEMLAGLPGRGHDSFTLFGRAKGGELAAMREAFFERCAGQAKRGFIKVYVPHAKIEEWRRGCGQARGL